MLVLLLRLLPVLLLLLLILVLLLPTKPGLGDDQYCIEFSQEDLEFFGSRGYLLLEFFL